ncbi:MAG: hypothetical protein IJU44_07175 [Kiritimatiellae bacterium]|nr:hypothetical protein [Kiritimatiellia bacterium]
MGDVFGVYSWAVRTYECGPDGAAKMSAICDYLQEAASLNAETLAFSKSDFEAAGENISWVLTRLKVRMSRFPKWGETVSILTFPRGGRKIVAYRDFILTDSAGEELGRATSEWMLIDLASRKMVAIPEGVFAAANTVREPVFGDEPFAKLRWDCRETAADALSFRAMRGDIDLNGHVNNVRYIEWLLEGRPDGAGPCHELDIVFKSETLADEEVRVETVETEPAVFIHRVFAPNGRDHAIARTAAPQPKD